MNLRPARRSRERILTYGPAGTGKSYGLLTIASKVPQSQFYCIDNDNAYERLLEDDEFTGLDADDGGNVHIIPVRDWDSVMDSVKAIQAKMNRDDWMVIDSTTPTWQYVQDAFVEKVFGKNLDEYFLDVRRTRVAAREQAQTREQREAAKKLDDSGAFEGWKDWPVINAMYGKLHDLILNCPGHVYCTAEMDALSKNDDGPTAALYGSLGSKPKGQKRMPHIFQTILLMKKQVNGWVMTTAKDRSREEVTAKDVGKFSRSYLWEVAGWRPRAT